MELGRISAIYRYPVKSMAGELLDVARLSWHGIEGDRTLAFRRLSDKSGFPWLRASKLPRLLLYKAFRLDGNTAEFRPNIVVETHSVEPFEEDRWVGQTLMFGDGNRGAAVGVTMRDERCVPLNFDPDTGERQGGRTACRPGRDLGRLGQQLVGPERERCVGERDTSARPPWFEFRNERRTRFEFGTGDAVLRDLCRPLLIAGWNSFDLT